MQTDNGGVPGAAQSQLWERQLWLGTATLESLEEVNQQVLELLRAQCRADLGRVPLLGEVGNLLMTLEAPALQRAAASCVLLVDMAFAEGSRWSDAILGAVHDRQRPEPFFTVDGAVEVMRMVITHAWHLARSQPAAARLLLGLSAANVSVIGGCSLRRLIQLAEAHAEWLRPRWENRPRIWRDLLRTAGEGSLGAAERMRVRGLQLLAADARQG
jgi:hypothetical protein